MEKKLRMTPEQVFEQARLAVRFARNLSGDVEFSPEDGYRSDPDFLCRVLEAVIDEGATTINIPDTVGYAVPELYGEFIRSPARAHPELRQGGLVGALPQRPRHGGGQLAGRREDRRRAPGRMHDQRPGRARRQLLARGGRDGGEDPAATTSGSSSASTPRRSSPASRLVSQTTGFVVQPNKAVVGANAFAHASGIHQDGVLKARDTYEIMRAEDVGWSANKIVLGKLSGRNAFKQRLQELGIELEAEADINAAFAKFKELADRKSDIFDEDILALVSDESVDARARALPAAGRCRSTRETGERPQRERRLRRRARSSATPRATATARSTRASRRSSRRSESGAEMLLYSVNAITAGSTESQGEVTVRLQHGGRVVNGVGADPDIVVASAKAYLAALNKLHSKAERVAAQG